MRRPTLYAMIVDTQKNWHFLVSSIYWLNGFLRPRKSFVQSIVDITPRNPTVLLAIKSESWDRLKLSAMESVATEYLRSIHKERPRCSLPISFLVAHGVAPRAPKPRSTIWRCSRHFRRRKCDQPFVVLAI